MSYTTVVSSTQPFIELNNQGQILRFRLDRDNWQLGRDLSWSHGAIPEVGWEVLSRRQAVIQKVGEDYRIYDGDRAEPSRNGMFINHHRIDCYQGYVLTHGTQIEIGQNRTNQILLTYFNPTHSPTVLPSKLRLDLHSVRNFPVELGREIASSSYASMQLDSPVVSRRHATIEPHPDGGYTLHDRSTNGTFVNGQRIDRPVQLRDDDRVRIGPFTLVYQQGVLELADRGNQIRLDAVDLLRRVKDKTGEEKTILDRVSLSIEPGQLVALVGGSGAGKSTLMKTLLGIEPTTAGAVYLNGDNLRQHFALYRSHIGYVPQDDIVHRDLTVEEVLSYACKLRLPPDTNVQEVVERTIEQIKLNHVSNTFIRDLSGGQRKRVSIGVELLADPKLFFLDEPTSGLDPGLDKEMMKFLRELADRGRTIILVTHATANLEFCDRVAFMGRGGNLCYFGTPQAALDFFEMPDRDFKYFADIYLKLERGQTKEEVLATVKEWASKFNSGYFQPSLGNLGGNGKTSISKLTSPSRGSSLCQQLLLLSQRYWQLVTRDRTSLLLALLTGPIGIILIRLAVQGKDPLMPITPATAIQASLALRTLFVFCCVGIWVGISCSAQEIVKEAAIYARERLVNLGLLAYIGSKLIVRSSIAIVQTLLLVATILLCFKSPDSHLLPWSIGLAITNFLTLVSSICLGLLLSTFVKNENAANNALPLTMIPQIIFSGVLFDLDRISEPISWLMLSHWSVRSYGSLVDVNAMIPPPINIPGLPPIPQPIKAESFYDPTWHHLTTDWVMLLVSGVVYLVIALYLQKRKDII
jgi:ABC-type multidrug transport system ATPase subunit/pSer/pThr/pTyr-binding forkhead associated (FHA) protein/ABC-type multidrug transport system permease subunit